MGVLSQYGVFGACFNILDDMLLVVKEGKFGYGLLLTG